MSERQDQLRYDLRHAFGLRKVGVSVSETDIGAELAELGRTDPSATVTIHYDEDRLQEIVGRQNYAIDCIRGLGTVVEVCPTSNRRIGGIASSRHHPIHRFLDRKLEFVIGSDDPGIFDTSTREEIEWVVQAADLAPEAFDYLAELSWRSRSEVLTGREGYQ